MPSIRQLAQLAGVSTATVSLALRNNPKISAATRQRIQQLAKTYHYKVPHAHPQFNSRFCGAIGCVVPSLSIPIDGRTVEAIEASAFADSYHVVILLTHGKICDTCLAIETLIEQHTDGLLINTTLLEPLPGDILLQAESQGIPLVLLNDTPATRPQDLVIFDYVQTGMLTIEYLFSLGHRHILYLGGKNPTSRDPVIAHAAQRFGMQCTMINASRSAEAIECLTREFQRHPQPTAVVVIGDTVAPIAYRFARQAGLHVPRDLSIVGCGNTSGEWDLDPSLTTIDLHPEEVGRRAYALLRRRMREMQAGVHSTPETILIPPDLILRDSCAPPSRQPPSNAAPHPRLPVPLRQRNAPCETAPVTAPVSNGNQMTLARLLISCDPPKGKRELMALLGLHHVNHFRHSYIDPALQLGLIARTLPDKPNSCKQQYRITEQGKRWLREQT
ncbi:MAG: LacI family DNA-binding transcriptional regulator [Armatimonadota bacterium]